jgi:fumarate reductase flavoprotein subunit
MHRDGTPIKGLYAAGGAMGGLQGGPQSKGYTGGWSEATTFGLLAAEHAMAHRP